MLVTFESDEDAAAANEEEDLVVCARFEAAADVALPGVGYNATPLPLGSIAALPSCALRPGGSAVESDWVLGEKVTEIYQQQIPKVRRSLVFDGNSINQRAIFFVHHIEHHSVSIQQPSQSAMVLRL